MKSIELSFCNRPEIPETNDLLFFVFFFLFVSYCSDFFPFAYSIFPAILWRCCLPLAFFFSSDVAVKHVCIPLADFHPDQPPADSPKHQQKIDKNSPGSNNNSGSGGGACATLSGVGSSATLPSQGSHLPLGSVEAQLKYENDRLKLALAQR